MKKFYLLLIAIFCVAGVGYAQVTVETDPSAGTDGDAWVGFMNVFELDETTYAFGSGWGVADLKTVVDASGGTITLQPNFNTYADNPDDPFWVNQTTGEGNKFMNANTFIEDPALIGQEVTFTGGVESNTIDPAYTVYAFIKVFNADFSVLKQVNVPLVAGEVFSVVYTDVDGADAVFQYGFAVDGPNANPADEATIGSVVVGPNALNVNDTQVALTNYPNPVSSVWNVQAASQIQTVEIFNILGQKVLNVQVDATNATINMATLKAGVYVAQVTTDAGQSSVRLIKK
ncbi:MAG: T9SS type A sorting domain-containing protein [Gilvibacter sp.]